MTDQRLNATVQHQAGESVSINVNYVATANADLTEMTPRKISVISINSYTKFHDYASWGDFVLAVNALDQSIGEDDWEGLLR